MFIRYKTYGNPPPKKNKKKKANKFRIFRKKEKEKGSKKQTSNKLLIYNVSNPKINKERLRQKCKLQNSNI